VSDDAELHSATLDGIHRHWPVACFVASEGLLVWLMVDAFEVADIWRYLVCTALFVAIFGVMWYGQKRRRIILSSGGVVVKGWFFETVAHLHEVKRMSMTLEDDSLGLKSIWDDGFGEFLASVLAQLTVRPVRWVLRRTIYGGKSDVFYRGVLQLFDMNDKRLMRIEASDGWMHVEEMFEKITKRVEQRARELHEKTIGS
jgi:hypothetical protein